MLIRKRLAVIKMHKMGVDKSDKISAHAQSFRGLAVKSDNLKYHLLFGLYNFASLQKSTRVDPSHVIKAIIECQ